MRLWGRIWCGFEVESDAALRSNLMRLWGRIWCGSRSNLMRLNVTKIWLYRILKFRKISTSHTIWNYVNCWILIQKLMATTRISNFHNRVKWVRFSRIGEKKTIIVKSVLWSFEVLNIYWIRYILSSVIWWLKKLKFWQWIKCAPNHSSNWGLKSWYYKQQFVRLLCIQIYTVVCGIIYGEEMTLNFIWHQY